jgi:hypothetical protein
MIPKSGNRFSDKIMRKKQTKGASRGALRISEIGGRPETVF